MILNFIAKGLNKMLSGRAVCLVRYGESGLSSNISALVEAPLHAGYGSVKARS